MDLVTPDVGLLFWTSISFAILYLILKKFAWKPILGSVNDREKSIKDALLAAENAKNEMENLKSDNEKILKQAKIERETMLKEAREIKAKLISDASNYILTCNTTKRSLFAWLPYTNISTNPS